MGEDVNEKVSDTKISSEIEELKKAVDALKDAIIDIRTAISELENPFNLLRVFSTSRELDGLLSSRSKFRKDLKEEAEREKKADEVTARTSLLKKPSVTEEKIESRKDESIITKPDLHAVRREEVIEFDRGFSLLKWVWALMDAGMTRDDLVNITKYCERMGYLPLGSSELIEYVIEPMFKARLGGLTLDEFMLIIYSAARASGLNIKIKHLEDMAFTLLRKILKKINNDVPLER